MYLPTYLQYNLTETRLGFTQGEGSVKNIFYNIYLYKHFFFYLNLVQTIVLYEKFTSLVVKTRFKKFDLSDHCNTFKYVQQF